jgi:hypothetical protein
MPLNQFNKEEVVLFEQVLEQFDSDNTVAKQAARFRQPGSEMQRRGDTVWRPVPQISTLVQGLDITLSIGSVTQMSVPSTLSTIDNVPFELDAQQMRDDLYRERKAKSAAQALSAGINRAMANNVKIWGSLTVRNSVTATQLAGYDDVSLCDAVMIENDILGNDKTMVLGARDYNRMGGNLASRTLQPRSEKALSDTDLGPIANFNSFKTSYAPSLAAAAGGATLVAGIQKYVPVSTSLAATGEESNVDNRTMNLVVDNTAGVVAGDKFYIGATPAASIKAVSHINKNDTGQPKTFTVVSVVDGTTLQIAPPIIVAGGSDAETDYANSSRATINNEALTWLNTVTALANPFFMNDSIEVFGGNLAFGDDMAGVAVMRAMTDSGIEVIFAKQGNVKTGKSTYRFTTFYGVTNLNPEMNGILIGGQTF